MTIQLHPLALFMKSKKKQESNQILNTQFFRSYVLTKSIKEMTGNLRFIYKKEIPISKI